MASQRWFVEIAGSEQGPLDTAGIRYLLDNGRVTMDTRVRRESDHLRMVVGDIPGVRSAEATFDPSAPASELFDGMEPEPAPAASRAPAVAAASPASAPSQFDPSAKPEDLFENFTSTPSGTRRSAEAPPRPPPRPLPSRTPATRDEERAQSYLAAANPFVKRPVGARQVEALLDAPPWQRLWPLAALTLLLGWIIGGFLSFERMYGSDDVLPILLLAVGGVPLACAAMLHYLQPRRIPVGTAIGVALFTAIAGIFLLLCLQFLAAVAAHSTRGYVGRGGAVLGMFAIIGHLYALTESANIAARWVGFVFGVGLFEEMTKLLPLVMLVLWRSDRHLSVHAFLFAGFASGIGFGVAEAFYGYVPWYGNHGLDSNIIRWYSAVPSHAIYTTVCAAFLWHLADNLEHSEGFWERAMVVAMAAGVMAVVHGTYNTVCSIGIIPALLMELVSFALLVWAVNWVSRDATEPQGTTPTPWLAHLIPQRNLGVGLGVAAVLLVGAGLLSSPREAVETDMLRTSLPAEFRPYVEGVVVTRNTDGEAWSVPLAVRFQIDPTEGIVGYFRNSGDAPITALTVDCRSPGGEHELVDLGKLEAGEEARIDSDDGWTFAPGEKITVTVNDRNIIRIKLP